MTKHAETIAELRGEVADLQARVAELERINPQLQRARVDARMRELAAEREERDRVEREAKAAAAAAATAARKAALESLLEAASPDGRVHVALDRSYLSEKGMPCGKLTCGKHPRPQYGRGYRDTLVLSVNPHDGALAHVFGLPVFEAMLASDEVFRDAVHDGRIKVRAATGDESASWW